MTVTTYAMGILKEEFSEQQVLVPCIENGVFFSESTEDLPEFIPITTFQADWNETDSDSVAFIKNKPTFSSRSQSSATRSLNNVFQISSTRDSLVNYSVEISCTLNLATGQAGTVYLEIASDSSFTSNVQEVARFYNQNSGSLTIGLNLTQSTASTLSGYVPAGYYCRLRTENAIGTPTFTYRSGQEVLL